MTREEFDAALAQTRIKLNGSGAARLVLVNGFSMALAGRMSLPPMSRQQVYELVRRISDVHCRSVGAPDGWETITLTLPKPSQEWDEAEELQRKALSRLSNYH